MIPNIRKEHNKLFTQEKYTEFLNEINAVHPGDIEFRLAETAVFVPKDFTEKMLAACESIVDVITSDDFIDKTKRAIPEDLQVPGENNHSHFIAFDFGVCINNAGQLEPQLIEMQGFPTLFAYEILLDDVYRKHFPVPENFSTYLGGYNRESYLQLLKKIILGTHNPENVILLEIFPEKQKTRIDFACTTDYTGIQVICLTDLHKEGNKLFYYNNGIKTPIHRIYNRLIFDDLQQQPAEVQEKGKILFESVDVEWVPHPSWFYRISKFTLPLINNPYVPHTQYLDKVLPQLPENLQDYVLKPLFSFAGQGVIIDVTPEDIAAVKDPENWILQKKVKYADVLETPDIPAKVEIRIFYFWEDGASRPVPTNNLSRISKGKMIGVRYNMDKTWVGGSYCLFEQ